MPSHSEIIQSCLELVAERQENIAPLVYKRFFEVYPEAETEFGVDEYNTLKDEMIVRILMELVDISEGQIYTSNIRRWITDHETYGVELPMYKTMFMAVLETMQEVAEGDWTEAMSEAWLAQFKTLEDILVDVYGDKYPL